MIRAQSSKSCPAIWHVYYMTVRRIVWLYIDGSSESELLCEAKPCMCQLRSVSISVVLELNILLVIWTGFFLVLSSLLLSHNPSSLPLSRNPPSLPLSQSDQSGRLSELLTSFVSRWGKLTNKYCTNVPRSSRFLSLIGSQEHWGSPGRLTFILIINDDRADFSV